MPASGALPESAGMRTPLLALAAATALLASAGSALACSCIPYRSAAEHLAAADLVFKGRVLTQQSIGDGRARTTFRVAETLKGRAGRTIGVQHHTVSATCGVVFKPGQSVWVFANRRNDGSWSTNLCSLARFPETDYRRAARGEPVPTAPPVF